MRQRPFWLLIFIVLFCNTACVGPTTPFGALESVNKNDDRNIASSTKNSLYTIKFHPEKQVLHDKTNFSVEIKSLRPFARELKIKISYNNIDVTQSFLKTAQIYKDSDNRTIIYTFKNMRLKTLDMNHIKVQVLDNNDRGLATRFFEEPECSMYSSDKLAHLGEFHAPEDYIDMIERVSGQNNTNPSFLAGVVAQESGFDPKAVSWAKAIGLTQMTPLAEEQVMKDVDNWPRYPGINSLSYLTLKSKIYLGEINHAKEWRLNPEKSLQGGLAYFRYLQSYWGLESNVKLVDKLGGNKDKVLTELILASYNSGAARVKSAVQGLGHNWKQHESLHEAVKYLKKVSSYCYHYTKKEVQDDNET